MKRNGERSTYAYKRPYQYSPLYQQWRQAVKDGRNGDAHRLSEQHSRAWLGAVYKSFAAVETFSPEIRT